MTVNQINRIKLTTLLVSIIMCFNLSGQDCECEKYSLLKDLISCTPMVFDNNTSLHWSFNCDSSWLTFMDAKGIKKMLFSLGDGLVNLTGRLGYIFAFEYNNSFLMQNNVISGCCSPPEFYLYDKSSGELRKKLGRIIFYSKDRNKPYIISVTNSNYTETNTGVYESITIYSIDLDETSYVKLRPREIANALDNTEQMYPEYLFNEPIIKGDSVIMSYYLRKPKDTSDKPIKTIRISFKK
jgi:hypothetical protein